MNTDIFLKKCKYLSCYAVLLDLRNKTINCKTKLKLYEILSKNKFNPTPNLHQEDLLRSVMNHD